MIGRPIARRPISVSRLAADLVDLVVLNRNRAQAYPREMSGLRTWFSLPDYDVFACAGIWRDTPEWGPAYSMVMTEACLHVADVHDRMPVILPREEWSDWLDGGPDKAALLCRPYPSLMTRKRTDEPWVASRTSRST